MPLWIIIGFWSIWFIGFFINFGIWKPFCNGDIKIKDIHKPWRLLLCLFTFPILTVFWFGYNISKLYNWIIS